MDRIGRYPFACLLYSPEHTTPVYSTTERKFCVRQLAVMCYFLSVISPTPSTMGRKVEETEWFVLDSPLLLLHLGNPVTWDMQL